MSIHGRPVSPQDLAELLDYVPGRHVFVVFATYRLSDPPDTPPEERSSRDLLMSTVACFACEQPWKPGMLDTPCPGDESGLLPSC